MEESKSKVSNHPWNEPCLGITVAGNWSFVLMTTLPLKIHRSVNGRERQRNDDENPMRCWEKKTTKHAEQLPGKGLALQIAHYWCIKGDAHSSYQ
eukprot:jgi/Picsp_1/2522/NSC_00753-R1_---NA---